MEARIYPALTLIAAFLALGASHRTPNFQVTAPTQEVAVQVGQMAEQYRRELAILWLGRELPRWADPCPIILQVGPNLGAGGATSFVFDRGEVFRWHMTIQGTPQRIIDSVLPHEVTHTIFASHFRRPLPRWADEGACTTVEHESERRKQQQMLVQFLQTNRGIAFSEMFAMREYPPDVMPLYSQGYSLCRFLIQQGGRQRFVGYIGEGMRSEQWGATTKQFYGFNSLGELQVAWVEWVRRGSPNLESSDPKPQPESLIVAAGSKTPSNDPLYRAQSDDRPRPQPEAPGDALAAAQTALPRPPAPNDPGWRPASATSPSTDSAQAYPRDEPLAVHQPVAATATTMPAATPFATPAPAANPADAPVALASSVAPAERQVLLEWSRDSGANTDPAPPLAAIQDTSASRPPRATDDPARQAARFDASRSMGTILR